MHLVKRAMSLSWKGTKKIHKDVTGLEGLSYKEGLARRLFSMELIGVYKIMMDIDKVNSNCPKIRGLRFKVRE